MITVVLVRHGLTDAVDRTIAGTAQGTGLNAVGHAQVRALAARLATVPLTAVVCSPLQRALETAEPIARAHRLAVQKIPALGEMEFGAWTGAAFTTLEGQPEWQHFNQVRSLCRPPGGELMLDVQQRAIHALLALHSDHEGGRIAVVSHGDVIRAVLMYCLGMPLDFVHRLQVDPCRVSVIQLYPGGAPIVRQVNGDSVTLPA